VDNASKVPSLPEQEFLYALIKVVTGSVLLGLSRDPDVLTLSDTRLQILNQLENRTIQLRRRKSGTHDGLLSESSVHCF